MPDEYLFPALLEFVRIPRGVGLDIPIVGGGGVVSSDDAELSLAEEFPSLFEAPEDEAGGVVGFMATRIDAASNSWTC